MKTTRHKNIEVFLDHYTNIDRANARRIDENLEQFIESGGANLTAKVNEKVNGVSVTSDLVN